MPSILLRLFPFLRWFPMSKDGGRADLIAGITVALVLVPQSMAYRSLLVFRSFTACTLRLSGSLSLRFGVLFQPIAYRPRGNVVANVGSSHYSVRHTWLSILHRVVGDVGADGRGIASNTWCTQLRRHRQSAVTSNAPKSN